MMKKAMVLLGVLAASPASAVEFEDYATVRSVKPQVERVNHPRQECSSEYVTERDSGERGLSGSIIGGLAGAILGNQVGGGNGRTAATAAGAVTGAIVGDRMQNDSGTRGGEREVRRCHQVDNWEKRIEGYKVAYEYGGHRYSTVLPYDPGSSMKVRVSVEPQ